MATKKALMLQTNLLPVSGANVVAAWIIQALVPDHEVTVLTWDPVDWDAVNTYYGTSLCPGQITAHHAPAVFRRAVSLDPDPYSFLRLSFLMRVCKMVKNRFDVLISANDEIDYGCPGIQYFHYPYLGPASQQETFRTRQRPWRWISGFSFDRMKANLTLVNSDWTGSRARAYYGIQTRTVYPPVPGEFPEEPWSGRENGFVCIGKIAADKRTMEIVRILAEVRSRGHDVHLHFIGIQWMVPEDVRYYRQMLRLLQKNSEWIRLHERIPRNELVRLVASHRYAIHGKEDEHFGIAVAELVRGGCIVFVPCSGGQMEIVGGDDRLLFGTEQEAVEKICRVLDDPDQQDSLRGCLAERRDLFSAERFVREIQDVVGAFSSEGVSW